MQCLPTTYEGNGEKHGHPMWFVNHTLEVFIVCSIVFAVIELFFSSSETTTFNWAFFLKFLPSKYWMFHYVHCVWTFCFFRNDNFNEFCYFLVSSAYWMFHCVGKCVDNKELQRQSQVLPRNQVFSAESISLPFLGEPCHQWTVCLVICILCCISTNFFLKKISQGHQ